MTFTETQTQATEILDLLIPRSQRMRPNADGPVPTQGELDSIVMAASSVPDHGNLRPWRFVWISGQARERFANALAADIVELRGNVPPAVTDKMRSKAYAAPGQLVIIASPVAGSNIPQWEQLVSAGCCGYAAVLAATALGLGAVWKSAPLVGTDTCNLFEIREGEQILGWVNLGGGDESAPRPQRRSQNEGPNLTVL